VLDLAARGALAIEAVDAPRVQIRLVQPDLVRGPVEQAVWAAVEHEVDHFGVVPPGRLRFVRHRWTAARQALLAELEARGWFDPHAGARRRPLYVAGALAMAAATMGVVVALIGREPIGAVGPIVLAIAGVIALTFGVEWPSTTLEGANAAVAWRGYRAGLRQARNVPEPLFDLDEALPFAVALGSTKVLSGHLKRASERGYAPAWFMRNGPATTSFYPYWVGFHSSLGPSSSSGGSSAGASAGGASGGGSF
jgi:hypothetical protein